MAYQQVAIAWQASWNGMVRPTARAVRLRACPAPKTCRASSIATSIDHRAAYSLRAYRAWLGVHDHIASQPPSTPTLRPIAPKGAPP